MVPSDVRMVFPLVVCWNDLLDMVFPLFHTGVSKVPEISCFSCVVNIRVITFDPKRLGSLSEVLIPTGIYFTDSSNIDSLL